MDKNKNTIETSKFLSYVLRHQPESIGLELDSEGWARISSLIECAAAHGKALNLELIQIVVSSSDKKRFAISEDGFRVRAVQGHSTEKVNITFEEKAPPDFLYHGTATRFMDAIRAEGLRPGSRQYVHLSMDESTAISVGQRHGKPVVLKVRSADMHERGYFFFLAENGVWLTEAVPVQYFLE